MFAGKKMEYARLIHEYVDGSLDPGKEEELFLMLSSSDELRADLKQQFAIKNAVKSDTAAFTPAADSTLKIFGALGFTPPPAPAPTVLAPTPVPSSMFSTIGKFIRQYSQGFIGGIISAVATSLLFTAAIQSDLFKSGNEQFAQNSATKTVIAPESNALPFVKSEESTQQPVIKERIVYKNVYIPVKAEEKQDLAQNNVQAEKVIPESPAVAPQEPLQQKYIFVNNQLDYPELRNLKPNFGVRNIQINSESPVENQLTTKYEPIGLSFELLNGQYFSFPEETITPEKYQKFNNIGLALFYEISDEFKLGFEYRRENFFQRYTGMKDGLPFLFEQQPNFESYGITARYQPIFAATEYFLPYAQLSFGGNTAGPLGRVMVGTEFLAGRYFSFILGVEYSRLQFKHNGNSDFSAEKAGAHFGVKFKF